ncbi:hypothetical protein ATEIFO6365_0005039500 [Aspergillus terreus]|uniref:Uncharacterized protein n=1 Tax=Aspergillus terreus TaxID=33178 RepID=A0A5M3Z2D9_ASPTE|nr:hypothetical protein ATETN484_0007040000 [Aspergillus terreus]GFF16205.1 hypothetical protein ATEIFO6365_0005039500 [Aspergillus terreus]
MLSPILVCSSFKWLWLGAVCALFVGGMTAQTITLPDWFNGYYIHLVGITTETSSASCEKTMPWASSGEYSNCRQTTDLNVRCPMLTACVNSTVMFDNGSSYTCVPNQSCATMTVYQTSPFGLPSSKQAFLLGELGGLHHVPRASHADGVNMYVSFLIRVRLNAPQVERGANEIQLVRN